MTLKNLRQRINQSSNTIPLTELRGLPFWIWEEKEHKRADRETKGRCCFNHIIGLPRKNSKEFPLFDYQQHVLEALLARDSGIKDKHVWIKKCRGAGITELMIRFMAWLCLKDDTFNGAQMAIITGPRVELAIDLIDRMKLLFEGLAKFDTDKTVIGLNGCTIKAYPSNANTSRGQPNMQFILLDEADFFAPTEQRIAREAAEGYIGKNNPYIVMVSTPNLPGGLYEQIEKEREETTLYRRILLPYNDCLGRIYSDEEMTRAKASPSFEREYNLAYGHGEGNVFPVELVNLCVQNYDLAFKSGRKVIAIDPAYGSSNFALLILEKDGDFMYVKEAIEYPRPSPSAMLENIVSRAKQCGSSCQILVDSAHPGLVTDLKEKGLNVESIVFREKLSDMTFTSAQAIKEQKVKIHPGFNTLIQQLRAARFNEKGHVDKTRLSFDLGDAFLMGVSHIVNGSGEVGYYAWEDDDGPVIGSSESKSTEPAENESQLVYTEHGWRYV